MHVRSLLTTLEERGTLVAPDVLPYLEEANVPLGDLEEALLHRDELPLVLTLDHVQGFAPEGQVNGHEHGPADASTTDDAPGPVATTSNGGGATAVALRQKATPATSEREETAEAAPAAPDTPATPQDPDGATPAPEVPDPSPGEAEEAQEPSGNIPRTEPVPRVELEAFDHRWSVVQDITGESTCEGEIDDFKRYFNDRLRRLRKLLGKRREMVGMVPVRNIQRGAAEVKVAGIVREVRSTQNGHRLIELEDETGVALVLASKDDEEMIQLADTVIEDEVLGVVAKPASRGELLIMQNLVRPEVPRNRNPARADRSVAACFISDVHIGAGTFLADDWERFVRWINGQEGTPAMKRLAKKVRYLVVVGDLVDGVGMFPGQEEELVIDDGYEQYRLAGEQLERLRDDLQIIVSPGNHDLVRPAEPQPALPPKYEGFFPENVAQVGNPCLLELEGVRTLIYHGRSIDDWITRVQGLTYQEPIPVMREMMKRRHLVPLYGLRTPIAPEHKDNLVIDPVPDIFVTGHVHMAGMESWRNVTLVNSSCWQGQTPFQKMHGTVPEPGRAAVVELDTGDSHMINFHRGEADG